MDPANFSDMAERDHSSFQKGPTGSKGTSTGDYKNKLFQRLTEDTGHPRLREHLAAVVMLMKYSPNWRVFMDRLDQEFPQWGANYLLPFPDDYQPPNDEAANSGGLTAANRYRRPQGQWRSPAPMWRQQTRSYHGPRIAT